MRLIRTVAICAAMLSLGSLAGAEEYWGPAATGDPVFRHRSGSFWYQHDRQRYYGAYDYRPHDVWDHYPQYHYGFGMPTYHWGWFGAHHRPRRVVHGTYYDDVKTWSYHRGY